MQLPEELDGVAVVGLQALDRGQKVWQKRLDQVIAAGSRKVGHVSRVARVVSVIVGCNLLGAEGWNPEFLHLLCALFRGQVNEVNRRLSALYLGELKQRLAGFFVQLLLPALGRWSDLWSLRHWALLKIR